MVLRLMAYKVTTNLILIGRIRPRIGSCITGTYLFQALTQFDLILIFAMRAIRTDRLININTRQNK